MPIPRLWTIVVSPPKTGVSKTYAVSERTLRALKWGVAAAALLVAAAGVMLFAPFGTPGAWMVAKENRALRAELQLVEQRFQEIDDTLRVIAERENQMRMLAGLPVEERDIQPVQAGEFEAIVGPTQAGVTEVVSLLSPARRPFEGRLGWNRQPVIEGLIARASELASGFRSVSDTLQRNYARFASTPSILPTAGWLSSQFTKSRFHPILHENRPHEGIDVTAPTGTPIVAPAAGRVVRASSDKGYGLTVEIDHGNGILTRFAHCSRIAVRVGQQVTRGQLIAAVGSTGLSTAPHLHYEIHVNGKPVDPLTYVLPDAD